MSPIIFHMLLYCSRTLKKRDAATWVDPACEVFTSTAVNSALRRKELVRIGSNEVRLADAYMSELEMRLRMIRQFNELSIVWTPCDTCGRPTSTRGTARCDRCWELEHRLKDYLMLGPKAEEFVRQAILATRPRMKLR